VGIAVKILLTLLAAWLLRVLARRLIRRFAEHYTLPPEMVMGARRITSFVVYFSALLYILSLLGASPSVLWTAFTGFAAVGGGLLRGLERAVQHLLHAADLHHPPVPPA
jgi:small-conductance mechanosensitive channel